MSFNTKENYYLFIPLQFKAKRNKMLFQIGPLLRLGSKCYDWDFYYARVQNNVITDETFSTIQGSSYNTYAFYSCRVLFLSGWNSYSYVVLLIDLKRAEQAACYPPPPPFTLLRDFSKKSRLIDHFLFSTEMSYWYSFSFTQIRWVLNKGFSFRSSILVL